MTSKRLVRNPLTRHSLAMPLRRSITVSITPEQEALIRACLQSGRFASTSEVVRAALRLLDRDEAASQVSVERKPATNEAACG